MSATFKTNPVLIDIPMPIITPRLYLRNVLPGDGKAMFEAKEESIDALRPWMPWAKVLGTEESSEIVARESHAEFILRKDIMIVGFEKNDDGTPGRFVIGTGLHRMDWEKGHFEIGYWVRSSATRKGYATESTNALIRYAFNALSAKKVIICHAEENNGSKTVIEKLGFEKEGVAKNSAHLTDGTVTHHHWYARFDDKNLPALDASWG